MLAYRDTYGQAQGCSGVHQGSSVDVSCLLWASPGICYLRAIGYFSMSQCATGPASECSVGPVPRLPRMEKNKPAHLLLPYDVRPLPGDSAPLGSIATAATRGGDEIQSTGGGRYRKLEHRFPFNLEKSKKKRETRLQVEGPKLLVASHVLRLDVSAY